MTPLNRGSIVAAAINVLDRVGFHALTTRLVAKELGVKQPALYWHFHNKRDLADAMAATMLPVDTWPGPETPGLEQHWLGARAHAFRHALAAHRDGALLHAGTTPSPEDYARIEKQVAALMQENLTRNEALRLLMAVSRYTVGWVLEEQAFLDRGETTGVPQAMIDLHQGDTSTSFDFGLQAILAGALIKRRRRP